jgi:hypothetical protein
VLVEMRKFFAALAAAFDFFLAFADAHGEG